MNEALQHYVAQISKSLDGPTAEIYIKLIKNPTEDEPTRFLEQFAEYRKTLTRALVDNEYVDLYAAQSITDLCELLLNELSNYSAEEQIVILAAMQYFLIDEDAISDTDSSVGMVDDIAVINMMLELINRPDLDLKL